MAIEAEELVQPQAEPTRGIVGAASILAVGNVASRVLGLARDIIIYYLFGATGFVSVLEVASTLVFNLYEFLVGGLITAALVPTFSEYAEKKQDYWQLVSTVLSVLAVLLGTAILVLEVLAEPIFQILGPGYDANLHALGVQMIRVILPAVFFLGVAGTLSSILYSLKRFTLPSFTTAAFNLGIILCSVLLSPIFGIMSVVVGMVFGALMQVVLQFVGLRHSELRFSLNFKHPALKHIVRLYIPVLGGLSIMLVGVGIDRNLASLTGAQSLAWMQAATSVVQLPLGLVATAISFAILPNLSRALVTDEFRHTLVFGLKLVLLLILPCVIALFALAGPVVALLYQHGAFTANDTIDTAQAVRFYLLGTVFAAIDQPLVFAFYARKNTLLPNLVALLGLGVYLVVALALVGPLGYLGLVLANSAQLAGHALVMMWLTQTRLGGVHGVGLSRTTLKIAAAGVVMGAVMYFLPKLNLSDGLIDRVLTVLVPAAVGGIIYIGALKVLRVQELEQMLGLVRRRTGV